MANPAELAARPGVAGRELIEGVVTERATRVTAEQVQETCSFARAERLLGREYHGRFLIELLQNAADAWREESAVGTRSKVRIELAEGPSLLVANQGRPFPASAVIESLGHIGRSTKAEGEAIGHKGIGFKAVLEISLTPELYSGLGAGGPSLAVRFDPREALQRIRSQSEGWDSHLAAVDDIDDPVSAVPVLRYPTWIESLPTEIRELQDAGFDTVVRLPFDADLPPDPTLDEETWVRTVREAISELTDEMIILLGTFDRVEVFDKLEGREMLIQPSWGEARTLRDGATSELVDVARNREPSSHWRLYRRTLDESQGLTGEVAVGVRTATEDEGVLPAVDLMPSSPFHLFFPTKIGSGLPFLLHGYFKVNAARTGFYEGSAAQNEALLSELAGLVAAGVADTAEDNPAALTSLPDLLGAAGEPEDLHARAFRYRALELLDEVRWVPIEDGGETPACEKPTDLLVDERKETVDSISSTFGPDYIYKRTGLGVPSSAIGTVGHAFLLSRRPGEGQDVWIALETLLRPGLAGPWDSGEEDAGFRALLRLVSALEVQDAQRSSELFEVLRGDSESCLLPVVSKDGGREMLPLPDPSEAAAGRRSVLVMARTRDPGGTPIVPPSSMDVAFLRDGLLDSEAQVDRAKPLGVRDFTVDNVLDRLRGTPESETDAEGMLRFLWKLLTRERRGDFSTEVALERASEFDPRQWFWCTPGVGARSGYEAERQRRRRLLAMTRVPTRTGEWRPAGTLAFGADWADWLEGNGDDAIGSALRRRAAAYRGLEAIAPSPDAMLAAPEVVLGYLLPGDQLSASADEERLSAERHAFLLTLGVWEVLPVEAFESREVRNRDRFPWVGELEDIRQREIDGAGGWRFSSHRWSGAGHQSVWLAEDFRFLWSITDAAARNSRVVCQLLNEGSRLYAELDQMAAFCPGCTSDGINHTKRYSSSREDRLPSILAMQLQREPWVPVVLNGEGMSDPQPAARAWWVRKPPSSAGLRQSPLRYLRLCAPDADITGEIRHLARIAGLESADAAQVSALLTELRQDFEEGMLPVAPGASSSAKQAFIGLHRLAYDRLEEEAGENPDAGLEILERMGVLCEVGEHLEFVDPATSRHDDGRFAAYRRYFSGRIPFAVLARERSQVAGQLGIPPFEVHLKRRPSSSSRDVTDEITEIVGDRVPELLAILVHHSLGAQTLEPTSQQFEERSRRLRNLRVFQVEDLVVDAAVAGTDVAATIGEGSGQDVFVEGATTAHPVLYHDFVGEGWQDALRRKLHPHLAALVENTAYAATFKNLLVAQDDAEREEVLQELGITPDQVDAIRSTIGVVSEEEQAVQRRWFRAVAAGARGSAELPDFDLDDAEAGLQAAGLSREVAHSLVEKRGGEDVRSDSSPESPLSLLAAQGFSLADLDQRLKSADPHDGLAIGVGHSRLRRWLQENRKLAAAALSTRCPPDEAKAVPEAWSAPPELRVVLEPSPSEWLASVLASFQSRGFDPRADALAQTPAAELARLAGVEGPYELENITGHLFNPEEQARMLRSLAAVWRQELRFLGVLVRTTKGDGRSAIRSQADAVEDLLPVGPDSPTSLVPALDEVFAAHHALIAPLAALMADSLSSAPNRDALVELAGDHAVSTAHRADVERALDAPRRELARRLQRNIVTLDERSVRPQVPQGMEAVIPTREAPGRRKRVSTVKVSPKTDARKRRLGDEGERWALAAVLSAMVTLPLVERRRAIEEVRSLLSRFEGPPVDKALAHADLASEPGLDEEELIDELTELLHVSRHSDGFGFDLIGWLSPSPGAPPMALCLEVKSSSDGTFHLSRSEWSRALSFHEGGEGDQYAVLVVARSAGSAPPERLDLLTDPVELVETGQLAKEDDGYQLAYTLA